MKSQSRDAWLKGISNRKNERVEEQDQRNDTQRRSTEDEGKRSIEDPKDSPKHHEVVGESQTISNAMNKGLFGLWRPTQQQKDRESNEQNIQNGPIEQNEGICTERYVGCLLDTCCMFGLISLDPHRIMTPICSSTDRGVKICIRINDFVSAGSMVDES